MDWFIFTPIVHKLKLCKLWELEEKYNLKHLLEFHQVIIEINEMEREQNNAIR